jgi:hypothetical protein
MAEFSVGEKSAKNSSHRKSRGFSLEGETSLENEIQSESLRRKNLFRKSHEKNFHRETSGQIFSSRKQKTK